MYSRLDTKLFKRGLGATAAALLLASATLGHAAIPYDPFIMDADGKSGGITEPLESIGGTNFRATSIYEAESGALPVSGSRVIDTNLPAELAARGAPVDYTRQGRVFDSLTWDGDFDDPAGFTSGAGGNQRWGVEIGGVTNWGLTVDYFLEGVYLGETGGPDSQPLVQFQTGYLDLFFHNTAWVAGNTEGQYNTARSESIQVVRLELAEAIGQVGNIILKGQVNYDFLAGLDAADQEFAKNFFVDAKTGETFFDLLSGEGGAPIIEVLWRLDTNIDSDGNFANQLVDATVEGFRYRSTDLNATIRFESIPEPGTLALLGTALLLLVGVKGLSGMRRRRNEGVNGTAFG